MLRTERENDRVDRHDENAGNCDREYNFFAEVCVVKALSDEAAEHSNEERHRWRKRWETARCPHRAERAIGRALSAGSHEELNEGLEG